MCCLPFLHIRSFLRWRIHLAKATFIFLLNPNLHPNICINKKKKKKLINKFVSTTMEHLTDKQDKSNFKQHSRWSIPVEKEDRISALSDPLLFHIISFRRKTRPSQPSSQRDGNHSSSHNSPSTSITNTSQTLYTFPISSNLSSPSEITFYPSSHSTSNVAIPL